MFIGLVFMDVTCPVFAPTSLGWSSLAGHSVSDSTTVLLVVCQEACWCLLLWPGGGSSLNVCGYWGLCNVVACWCSCMVCWRKLSQLLWLLWCVVWVSLASLLGHTWDAVLKRLDFPNISLTQQCPLLGQFAFIWSCHDWFSLYGGHLWLIFTVWGVSSMFPNDYGPGMVEFQHGGIFCTYNGPVKVKFQQGAFLLKCSWVASDS